VRRGARIAAAAAAIAMVAGVTLIGQRFPFNRPPVKFDADPNAKYDGRFAFARLKYTVGPNGYYYCGLPSWAHGYASCRGGNRAETSLMRIMNEVSYLNAHVDDGVVLAVDDPELFKYPIAYMTEAGYWELTDVEAAAFRAYLQKGGFVIFDDFRGDFRGGGGWENFAANLQRVLPGVRFVEMEPTHPVFHSFFEIDTFDIIPQSYDAGRPVIRGVFEDNDPTKRLMAIINFNTDVSDFWEFSATGFRPIDESNQAYKLGVNYIIYGMTH
jgi:Domain of unknown function (DUF4159)